MVPQRTSKQRKHEHLENAPLPVIVCHGQRALISFANKQARPLLRIPLEQAMGKPITEVLSGLFVKDTTARGLERCLATGEPYIIREKQHIYVANGSPCVAWFDVTLTPLQEEESESAEFIAYFSDVSGRVVAAKSIDQPEVYLSSLFRHAPIGLVCYRGADFIVSFANDKVLEMWGRPLSEVKDKPIHEIFPEILADPEINARHQESLRRLKKGETHIVNEVELTFVRKGRPYTGWYNYIHEPYTNSAGEIAGMLAIAIEVTDQVLARKKLQMVTDALPSLVSYINSNLEYELVNKAYEKWFRRSRTEVVGKTISEVIGKDAFATVKSHVDQVFSGKTDNFETWIDYADGKRRYISASYIPHVDAERVIGYVGLISDLTERKQHEDLLLQKEARLRLIIEGIGAGTFDYDLQSRRLTWSEELKVLIGWPRHVEVGSEVALSIVHPDDLALVTRRSEELLAVDSGGYMSIDYRIIRKDNGETRWLHTRSRVLSDEVDGKRIPARIIGFSIDITESKIAEEKLRELTHNLEANVRERTSELLRVNDLLQQRNEELRNTQSVLQQIIDSSVELIAVVDRDLRFIMVNKAFETFVHKSRAELKGQKISIAYEGATGPHQVTMVERAFSGELVNLTEAPLIARPHVWFDSHYVPLDLNGRVEAVVILSRDITDITKTQRELADLNRQLKEAQHLSKLGSWEWDVSSGTVTWSDEMYHIYGYKEKFPVDFVKATERMSSEDADRSSRRTQEHIQRAMENFRNKAELVYEIPPVEFQIRLPDGENKILRNTGRIQLTTEGKMHRILGVVQDVTQIRSAEEKLRRLVDELRVKNEELESFNYVASHDLKEPLRNIRTMIDIIRLKKGEDPSTYLSKIDRAAARMSDLIESILLLSEVSNSDVQFSWVDLNKVLQDTRTDLESRIRERQAEISSDPLPVIWGHESQISQVFSNLLTNSMKFCKARPMVRISCEKIPGADLQKVFPAANAGHYWRIAFADNGIGFEPQYIDRLFEPFQRLHGKGEYGGTGIGLSIVKRIVECHSGFIKVRAQAGQGATFEIFLPAVPIT